MPPAAAVFGFFAAGAVANDPFPTGAGLLLASIAVVPALAAAGAAAGSAVDAAAFGAAAVDGATVCTFLIFG